MNPRSVFCNSRSVWVALLFTQALSGVAWASEAHAEKRAAPAAASEPTTASKPVAESKPNAASKPTAVNSPPPEEGDPNEPTSVTELAARGAELYHARQYRDAIEVYERAFAIDADPNLVFNLARCYEKLGELQPAIERYEQYIAMPGAETEGRLRAQSALDGLKRLQARTPEPGQNSNATASGSASAGKSSASPARSTPAEGKTDGASRSKRAKPADTPSVWPWVTFGAGLVGVGGGALLYVSGKREHQSLTEVDSYNQAGVYEFTRAEAEHRRTVGDEKKFWGVAAASAGGALLVTSLILFLVDGDERLQGERSVAFDVAPRVGGATVSVKGSL